jgi:hypothetical protein
MNRQSGLFELLAGLAGGVAAVFLGGLLGTVLSGGQGMGGLAGSVAGMLLAFPLGVGVGMGLVAHRLRNHKRPWLGLAGAILGTVLILLLAEPTGLNQNTTLLLGFAIMFCCLSAWAALSLPGMLFGRNH